MEFLSRSDGLFVCSLLEEEMGPEAFRKFVIGYIIFMLIAMGIMGAILISRFHLFGF